MKFALAFVALCLMMLVLLHAETFAKEGSSPEAVKASSVTPITVPVTADQAGHLANERGVLGWVVTPAGY